MPEPTVPIARPPVTPGKFRCELCWTEFDDPIDLLHHEAAEDDRLYSVAGLGEDDE